MKKIAKAIFFSVITLLLPAVALAQTLLPVNNTTLPGTQQSNFTGVFGDYLLIILRVVGLLAVAFIIYGGFQYITSGVNEELAEQGKKTLQNAVIGLIIIILSYVIVSVIINALLPGGSGS